MKDFSLLSPAQHGPGDMGLAEFRREAHRVADQVADYLERLASYRVTPEVEPGEVRARLDARPPATPEPMSRILRDYATIIEPNITHWQHPGFMAYFPSVASGPGILGEWLAAGLNSNVMFWKNAPASTELEQLVVDWLRQMLGLPPEFDGMLTDTASVSSLLSLVAARHAVPGLDCSEKGLAGREGVKPLRLYFSTEAHFSIEKAAIVVGVGRRGVRRIPVDEAYRMVPAALEQAIAEDRRAGWQPFCVVGTLGTTSSTSMDPADELARICRREGLWLHLDAAYAGAAALVPEFRPLFAGWEGADSIVFNPHKWMFTPFDASLLLFRSPQSFREAFRVVPVYLSASVDERARNYNEYGIQLGRRFRALKLWMQIRYFGSQGIADRIREHCRMAQELAAWIEAEKDWELLAPVPFSTVCFRYRPAGVRRAEGETEEAAWDRLNERILEGVNRTGRFFLSHTRLRDRFTLRVALGNPRARREQVAACWELLRLVAREAGG